MSDLKRLLALGLGVACAAIGLGHFILGIASVPGETLSGPTVDSRERYYAALFAAYGAAWVWAARTSPPTWRLMRWLALTMLVGGLGRVISLLQHGPPQWFQMVLGVIELVLPLLFLFPVRSELRATSQPGKPSPGRDEHARVPGET